MATGHAMKALSCLNMCESPFAIQLLFRSKRCLPQLEDLHIGPILLPLGDPKLRAHCRLWSEHVIFPLRSQTAGQCRR